MTSKEEVGLLTQGVIEKLFGIFSESPFGSGDVADTQCMLEFRSANFAFLRVAFRLIRQSGEGNAGGLSISGTERDCDAVAGQIGLVHEGLVAPHEDDPHYQGHDEGQRKQNEVEPSARSKHLLERERVR